MIGINIVPHTPSELLKVTEKENLNWRTFADDGTIAKGWNQPPTPAFYLIDHTGLIRHRWIGHPGDDILQQAVDKLLEATPR